MPKWLRSLNPQTLNPNHSTLQVPGTLKPLAFQRHDASMLRPFMHLRPFVWTPIHVGESPLRPFTIVSLRPFVWTPIRVDESPPCASSSMNPLLAPPRPCLLGP